MNKLQRLALQHADLTETQAAAFKSYPSGSEIPANVLEEMTTRNNEIKRLEGEIKQLEEIETMREGAQAALKNVGNFLPAPGATGSNGSVDVKSLAIKSQRGGSLKNITGEGAQEWAYRFGNFVAATLFGNQKALAACKTLGVEIKAQTEGTNSAGGYLVPDEFSSRLIDLKNEYGTFRQNSYVEPMSRETKLVPRRASGVTTYWIGENTAITPSDMAFSQISLVAKKLAALNVRSSELDEDSLTNLGDVVAGEMAWALAKAEDEAGFIGDGTNTYGSITGVCPALRAVDATIANIKGLIVASGNAYSEITLADFHKIEGRLPQFAYRKGRPVWYCSSSFYYNVMEKIALASGGATASEVANGNGTPRFLGHNVVFVEVMPSVEANSQICCLFGDLALATTFGDRRAMTLAVSTEYKFAEDSIAIKATERLDIKVHEVGTTDEAGAIVGLITAAA